MRLFSYVVAHDTGFSPNPFFGYCTLACCKPVIRRSAQAGDWVVGLGRTSLGGSAAEFWGQRLGVRTEAVSSPRQEFRLRCIDGRLRLRKPKAIPGKWG